MRDNEAPALDLSILPLPEAIPIIRLRLDPIHDEYGNPALEAWVIVEEDTPEDVLVAHMLPIKRTIRNALWSAGEERFVYFWFRKPSDLDPPARKKRRARS